MLNSEFTRRSEKSASTAEISERRADFAEWRGVYGEPKKTLRTETDVLFGALFLWL